MKEETTYQDIMCLFGKYLLEEIRGSNLELILYRSSDFLKIYFFQGLGIRKLNEISILTMIFPDFITPYMHIKIRRLKTVFSLAYEV